MYEELKKLNLEFSDDIEFSKAVRKLINNATGDFKTADGYFINPIFTKVYFYPNHVTDDSPSYGYMEFCSTKKCWKNYHNDDSPVFLKIENVQDYIKNRK